MNGSNLISHNFVAPNRETEAFASVDDIFDVKRLLQELPAFQEFPRQDVIYILRDAIDNEFDTQRRILYSQGDPITHLFLVIAGEVEEASFIATAGEEHASLQRRVGVGKLLGLYDLFYSKEHSTRARQLAGAQVIPLRAVAIDRLIYRFPELRNALAPMSLIERLRTIPLLGGLSQVGLGFVADACEYAAWETGQQLYDVGDPAEFVYFIDRGQVTLTTLDDEEHWLGNGRAFGFSETTYHMQATATTPTMTYRIRSRELRRIMGIDLNDYALRLRWLIEKAIDRLPLFADLSPLQRTKLAGFASHYYIPINHLVIQQGEVNDSLWILLPGYRARIHALDSEGLALQSTGVEGPAYFGEIALRLELPADSTIEAEAGSQWLRLHVDDLDVLSLLEGVDLRRRLVLREDTTSLMSGMERHRQYGWLQPGEFIIDSCRRHWIELLRKTWPAQLIFWLLFLPGISIAIIVVAGTWVSWSLFIVGLVAVGQFAWGVIDYLNDFLTITNRRVVRQEEVIFLKQWRQEATLEQVQNVDIAYSFWGNILGYGKLVIHTAGTEGAIAFDLVPNAEKIRTEIFAQQGRRHTHMMAEGKSVIQRLLEGRLGLRLHLPDRVRPVDDRRVEQTKRNWLLRLRTALRRHRITENQKGSHLIWRKHWLILLTQLLAPAGIFVMILAVFLFGQLWAWMLPVRQAIIALDLILAFLGLLCAIWVAWIIADWRNDTYEVNTESLVDVEKKPLFFSEQRRTARLSDIENIEVSIPSPLHYILDFGNVRLQTAARQGNFTFDGVPEPREVAAEIQRRISEFRRQQELDRARMRAQELPDWFELYDRLDDSQRRPNTPFTTQNLDDQ